MAFHTAKIVRDAAGVPTGIATIVPVTMVSAALSTVTQVASPDDIVIGDSLIDKVILGAVPVIISATVQKKVDTGTWGVPFLKPKAE